MNQLKPCFKIQQRLVDSSLWVNAKFKKILSLIQSATGVSLLHFGLHIIFNRDLEAEGKGEKLEGQVQEMLGQIKKVMDK
jgi:hypothetical protein